MSALTNYIVKAAVCTMTAVVVTEGLLIVKDTIKMKRAAVKQLRTDGHAEKDIKDSAKTIWLESIKEAARHRVEMIKTEPFGEIMGIWGCVTYFLGNWQGFNHGYLRGFDNASDGVNQLVRYFKDKFPEEMTSIINKARRDNADILLAQYAHGSTIERLRWVAEACDLPNFKEVLE